MRTRTLPIRRLDVSIADTAAVVASNAGPADGDVAPPGDLAAMLAVWPGVALRHLAAFVAVVEERSFRGAAARLRYTQPSVSHQLASLEQALGVTLVERGAKSASARPTSAGAALLPYVAHIAELAAGAEAQLLPLRAPSECRPR